MKNLSNLFLGLLVTCLFISYIGSINRRSYWKEKYLELQDNYEAISKENTELKDSIYTLNKKLIIH